MWQVLARLVIRYRLLLLVVLGTFTAWMAFQASQVEMTYSNPQIIPANHPKYIEYLEFKKLFGEDGNTLVLGIRSDQLFTLPVFNAWQQLAHRLRGVAGVEQVLSIGTSYVLSKDTLLGSFRSRPLFPEYVTSRRQLDSLQAHFLQLPFYQGLLYNPESDATLMAVRISSERLNSKERIATVQQIVSFGNVFAAQTGIEVHYSGMPMIRTVMTTRIADEMKLFLLLAAGTTLLALLLILRSGYAVVASLLVVCISVIWTLGTIHWFGYKITILTGLIPPLVVVISITNCIYLLNKYHLEYAKHGNRMKALSRMIEKIGLATLFTNLTAAIGFGVFYFTESQILKEFGLVAGLNIAAIFLISIILIPGFFSYVPEPKPRHIHYLDMSWLNWVLRWLQHLVYYRRRWIYLGSAGLAVLSLGGVLQLQTTGFIVDDIPHDDKVFTDLKFFEEHFHGVMPLEIIVDAKKKGAILTTSRLQKMDEFQSRLSTFEEFSRPLSVVEGLKFARQAFWQGDASAYQLPSELERSFILKYLSGTRDTSRLLAAYVDSSRQRARITVNVADVGTMRMAGLMRSLDSVIHAVFDTSKYRVMVSGASTVFLEGNRFIVDGLTSSLLLAFVLIALCMGYLFRTWRMIVFSLIPNLIPLLLTAGIMGYFGIPLKPSTVLVFSIAFGIAIDNAIRFLAKYQQELHRHQWNIDQTVLIALREAGISIIYTSIILFFGFIIFTLSRFGGTFYLGLLTSITLVIAMFNNLLLLPALLLGLRQWVDRRQLRQITPADHLDLVQAEPAAAQMVEAER